MKYLVLQTNLTASPTPLAQENAGKCMAKGWGVYRDGEKIPLHVYEDTNIGLNLAKKDALERRFIDIAIGVPNTYPPLFRAIASANWKAVILGVCQTGLLDELLGMGNAAFDSFVKLLSQECNRELYLVGISKTVLVSTRDKLIKQASYNYPYVKK